VAALKYVQRPSAGAAGKGAGQYSVFNLGTGTPPSPPCGRFFYFRLYAASNLYHSPIVPHLGCVPAPPLGWHMAWHGTAGVGYSVLDMVNAMKAASGRPLPYAFGPRRYHPSYPTPTLPPSRPLSSLI